MPGRSALIIVSVVNFLIGAILAFVGAVQLRKFAADIYVANLVGLALVREMAAVMTAIVMAGRTGGAYAARIATMQGNEEIDALAGHRHSGGRLHPAAVDPGAGLHHAAALPVRLPGRHARRLRGLHLDAEHHRRSAICTRRSTRCRSTSSCSASSNRIAFAILIGVTSCRIGLKAGRSAADVGVAATRAVVTGIVGVIALDASFAVLADVVGPVTAWRSTPPRSGDSPLLALRDVTLAFGPKVIQHDLCLRRAARQHLRRDGRQRLRQKHRAESR